MGKQKLNGTGPCARLRALTSITSHQVKLSLSNIWSLSLLNVNIKLDSLWSLLEATSRSLSHQYKRTLKGSSCRAKAKFKNFNSFFSSTWKPFIMLWQRSFSFYSPPKKIMNTVYFEELGVKFTKIFRKCTLSSQRRRAIELLWHVSARLECSHLTFACVCVTVEV